MEQQRGGGERGEESAMTLNHLARMRDDMKHLLRGEKNRPKMSKGPEQGEGAAI